MERGGEGVPRGGVGGRWADDVEHAGDVDGGHVGLVPAGGEGRAGDGASSMTRLEDAPSRRPWRLPEPRRVLALPRRRRSTAAPLEAAEPRRVLALPRRPRVASWSRWMGGWSWWDRGEKEERG